MMRKPKQPNTLGFYGLLKEKNARGVESLATEYTASAHKKSPQLHIATSYKSRETTNPRPKKWGFIYETRNRRYGLLLATERKVSFV